MRQPSDALAVGAGRAGNASDEFFSGSGAYEATLAITRTTTLTLRYKRGDGNTATFFLHAISAQVFG